MVHMETPATNDAEMRLAERLIGRPSADAPWAFIDTARRHRVHLLLAASMTPRERATPQGAALARELTVAAALNAWSEDETRRLLAALAARGVDALLLKGTGLAYTIYAEPHLRPRLDVDLLIRRASLDAAESVLSAEGWSRPAERDAELAEPQRHYVKAAAGGRLYHLDVHWKVANPRVFADALAFDDLIARAEPVPALGPSARTLSVPDALLLACVHRVAHHADAIDLLWLWDVHLLIGRLGPEARSQFTAAAQQAAICAVCRRGIGLAADCFSTPGAAPLAADLGRLAGASSEPSAEFIGGVAAASVLRSDLATLGWSGRVSLVAEHLFPSMAYMQSRYPRWPRALLPLAYVDRIVRGAPKWFRPWR
jgi:hypothetical protein